MSTIYKDCAVRRVYAFNIVIANKKGGRSRPFKLLVLRLRAWRTEDTSRVREAEAISFSSFISNVSSVEIAFHSSF